MELKVFVDSERSFGALVATTLTYRQISKVAFVLVTGVATSPALVN